MKNTLKKLLIMIMAIMLIGSLTACGSQKDNVKNQSSNTSIFPNFNATDFQGNQFTQNMFKDNPVTVLNIWFTGCQACVSEMPQLETLSKELKEKGVALVGVCIDDVSMDKTVYAQAEKILKDNNITYPNLIMEHGEEIDNYLNNIFAFPTTLLIDREGNIIGEPIVGSIDNQKQIDDLNNRIDKIIENDKQ